MSGVYILGDLVSLGFLVLRVFLMMRFDVFFFSFLDIHYRLDVRLERGQRMRGSL